MPSKSCHHAVTVALVFHFEHHPFIWLVSTREGLRDHPVEPRAFKPSKPVRGDAAVGGCGCEMDRRRRRRKQRLQLAPSSLKWLASIITVAYAKQVKEHERRWRLLRKEFHPPRRRDQATLQRNEN